MFLLVGNIFLDEPCGSNNTKINKGVQCITKEESSFYVLRLTKKEQTFYLKDARILKKNRMDKKKVIVEYLSSTIALEDTAQDKRIKYIMAFSTECEYYAN